MWNTWPQININTTTVLTQLSFIFGSYNYFFYGLDLVFLVFFYVLLILRESERDKDGGYKQLIETNLMSFACVVCAHVCVCTCARACVFCPR